MGWDWLEKGNTADEGGWVGAGCGVKPEVVEAILAEERKPEKGNPEVDKPADPVADALGKTEGVVEGKEEMTAVAATSWGGNVGGNCGTGFIEKGAGLDPEKEGSATAGLVVKAGDVIVVDVIGA
eukprot:RCo008330